MRVSVRQVRGRKKHPNWSGIVKEVERTLDRETKPMLIEYHKRITDEWSGEKPVFKAKKRVTRDAITVYVYPIGGKGKDKWIWLTQGTGLYGPKHAKYPIKPKKKGGVLAFPSVYTPRTRAGAGGQYKGPGTSSGDTVVVKSVMHPGIRPRPFHKVIARWARPKFYRQMEAAMKRGARRA